MLTKIIVKSNILLSFIKVKYMFEIQSVLVKSEPLVLSKKENKALWASRLRDYP